MKKISVIILSSLFALMCLASVVSAERILPLVVDNADLLTDAEEASLTSALETISASHMIEIAVVTVESTDGKSAMEYADDFYDYNGYGYGENDDGALLLIDIGGREWWISTHADGAYYLDDYALYMIENAFIDELSDGNYFEAFSAFVNACDSYIESAKNPTVTDDYYDDDYYYEYPVTDYPSYDYYYDDYSDSSSSVLSFILPSLIIGFVISFIMVSAMKKDMTTVRSADSASNYVVNGSLNLRSHSDRYLYSNTVRTRRDTSSHHSGSRGGGHHGGSSMHRSSSGRSHGGRGGRF